VHGAHCARHTHSGVRRPRARVQTQGFACGGLATGVGGAARQARALGRAR
jgi:hypothetical protein